MHTKFKALLANRLGLENKTQPHRVSATGGSELQSEGSTQAGLRGGCCPSLAGPGRGKPHKRK